MVSKPLQSSKLVSKSLDAKQPVPNLGGVAAFVKAVVKHTSPARGFLKPSTQVNSILLPTVSVATASSLVIKEDGVAWIPPLRVVVSPQQRIRVWTLG